MKRGFRGLCFALFRGLYKGLILIQISFRMEELSYSKTEMKNSIKTLILSLIITTFILTNQTNTYAQESTGTGNQTLDDILNQIDDEKIKNLETQLLLSLPLTTENPNHVITFTDPSPSQKGVFLQTDGKDYKQITSPYTLPTLGIGKHTLNFKFNDNVDAQQILERELIIIPRAPLLKPPVINGGNVTFSGTSIALAQVEMIVYSDSTRLDLTAITDSSGNWSLTYEKQFENGKYTIISTTRKNGLSSKPSEIMGFEIGEGVAVTTTTKDEKEIYFSFSKIKVENLQALVTSNPDLAILAFAPFFIGIFLTAFTMLARSRKANRKAESMLKNAFQPKSDKGSNNVKDILINNLANRKKVEEHQEIASKVNEDDKEIDELLKKLAVAKAKKEELEQVKEEEIVQEQEVISEKIANDTEAVIEDIKTEIEEKIINEPVESRKKATDSDETEESKEEMPPKHIKLTTKEIEKVESIIDQNEEIKKKNFLMNFKDFDPDDEEGNEVDIDITEAIKEEIEKSSPKTKNVEEIEEKDITNKPINLKDKRNIKISLTSKD